MKRKKRNTEQLAMASALRGMELVYAIIQRLEVLGIEVLPLQVQDDEVCHLASDQFDIIVRRDIHNTKHRSTMEVRYDVIPMTEHTSEAFATRVDESIRPLVRRFACDDVKALGDWLGTPFAVVEDF